VWLMQRCEDDTSSESQDEHATAHAAVWLSTGLSRLSSSGSRHGASGALKKSGSALVQMGSASAPAVRL